MWHDPLSRKDRIELLLEMQQRHRQRFDQRVSQSWKTSLALWSSLALLAGTLLTGRVNLDRDGRCLWIVGSVLLGVVALFYILWLWTIGKRNWADSRDAKRRLDVAERCLGIRVPAKDRLWLEKAFSCWCRYCTQILQGAVTVALAGFVILAFVVANARRPPCSRSASQPAKNLSVDIKYSEK